MNSNKKPLHALTGLRFVAAATVFVHHLGGKFGFTPNQYSIGSLAVTFFFVLSGFILTYVYHGKLSDSREVKRFWIRRFARIWPLHLVCLLLAMMVIAFDSKLDVANYLPKLAANAALVQSWLPFSDWVFAFNSVSWSISTEAFFYALFPFLIAGSRTKTVSRLGLILLGVAVVGAVMNFASQQDWNGLDYFRIGHVNPVIRLPEFCLGILGGLWFQSAKSKDSSERSLVLDSFVELAVIGLLVALCYWVTNARIRLQIETSPWGSEFMGSWFRVLYPAALMAIVVLVFARSRGLIARSLSHSSMIYLGDISYAFYMVHLLVLRVVSRASLSYGQLSGWQLAALCAAIALGLSILLYELVEMPARRLIVSLVSQKRERDRSIRLSAFRPVLMIGFGLVLVPGLVLRMSMPAEPPIEEVTTIVENSEPWCRDIQFGGKVVLLGCQIVPRAEMQQIDLHLAWTRPMAMKQRRVVFVLDETGKQIARGKHGQGPFEASQQGIPFADKVILPFERLADGHEVVVCFRKKGERPLKASSGRRKDNNKSLVLISANRLQQLKRQHGLIPD